MQAGNGKDVREARKARSLVQLLGNASPRAGDERDGDLAGLTLQYRPDAGVDACSQRIDARPGPEVPRQSTRVIQGLNLARRVTRRSEACKPGLPSKIESARLYRFRRGLKRSAERHCLADAAIGGIGRRHRDPHAGRSSGSRSPKERTLMVSRARPLSRSSWASTQPLTPT
jgi:hypothetical protein